MTDPFAARSLCALGYRGMPQVTWDSASNFNAPSSNQYPGNNSNKIVLNPARAVGQAL